MALLCPEVHFKDKQILFLPLMLVSVSVNRIPQHLHMDFNENFSTNRLLQVEFNIIVNVTIINIQGCMISENIVIDPVIRKGTFFLVHTVGYVVTDINVR